MLKIYLTRHGETEWNKENRLQGWKDSDLTLNGKENARLLGKRLNDAPIDSIYTSPSKRAVHTAKLIRGTRNLSIQEETNLREIYFGKWEGCTKESIEAEFKEEYDHFWNVPHLYNPLNHQGETLQDLQDRVISVLHRITAKHRNGTILIVAHAVVIRVLLSYVLPLPLSELWKPPFIHGTSLSILEYDQKKFEVNRLGDTSHME